MRGQSAPAGMISPPFVNGWNAEMDASSTTDVDAAKALVSDFYMLGWGVPTYDSEYIFNFLVHTKGEKYGSWSGTRFSDPDLDANIEALASETNLPKRDGMINDIWQVVQEKQLYIPIHHQVLNWGMKSGIGTVVAPDDAAKFKYFTMN